MLKRICLMLRALTSTELLKSGKPQYHATIQRRVAALRKFFNLLFSAGLISTRPIANLRLPKAWARVLRPTATEDLERVIAAIGTDSPFDVRNRALLMILRDTGPRVMAISQVELANVDWDLGRVLLLHDKFGKEHWVSLSKRSTAELRRYIETARPYFLHGRDLPYLFLSAKRDGHDGPISRQRVWQIATSWTKKVLGVPCSPHGWRRACLTEGAALGMDTFDLMNLAGHSSPDTTQRYIHHSIDHLKKTLAETHPRARKDPK
jgi:integrase/recombinase XerD